MCKDIIAKDMQDIEIIISYLNEKAGKRFRLVDKNRSLVEARLKNYSPQDIKRVIDFKCNEWTGDPKMEKYLRPDTLFRKSNFDGYYDHLEPEKITSLSPRQIEHRLYLKTPEWMAKREAIIKRSGHHCEGCGIYLGEKGQVHHKHYDNWKDEFLFDLIYLCSDCHTKVHNKNGLEYE